MLRIKCAELCALLHVTKNIDVLNPFRLSFSEPKCARGGHIIFMESIFQHSPHEIVIYSINRRAISEILARLNAKKIIIRYND